MYQLENNADYNPEYFVKLMDGRVFSSKETADVKKFFYDKDILPISSNYGWAMLCIAYYYAQKQPETIPANNNKGLEIPSFQTCFQGEAKFWLAFLSQQMFKRSPKHRWQKQDLYDYIRDIWHTGALLLNRRYQELRQAYPDELATKKAFLQELANLTRRKSKTTFSGSLQNPIATENLNTQCDELKKALDKTIGKSGTISPEYNGVRYDCFRVQFDHFVDLDNQQIQKQIRSELGIANDDLRCERIEGAANTWHINILRDEATWQKPSKPEFQAALAQYQSSGKRFRLPVCIGIDERGEAVFQDFATAPHAIIGGETMSGKTVFVRSMLLSLFELCPNNTEIVVAYCKQKTDFSAVEHYPNLWQQKLVIEPSEACEILQQFVEEMDRRYRLLDEYGVENVDELPENVRCKYTILMVDELADLIMSNKDVENHLIRLAQKARAANIYLMLATQRPDSTVLPGLLRDNLPTKIALKVGKHQSSTIILGESGAERLAKHGDHLIKWNGGATQFLHGYNV